MFQVGDAVSYGTSGVCRIEEKKRKRACVWPGSRASATF